jgi:hypothetical protein
LQIVNYIAKDKVGASINFEKDLIEVLRIFNKNKPS